MAVPESSLSIICNSVAEALRTGLEAVLNEITVNMGAPAIAAKDESINQVNLFFYRFAPSGFDSDTHPNDPWRMRLFCLITAFGASDDTVNAGENELRLLGEVMRIFHETPVLVAEAVDGEQVRLQVVFIPTTDEQINQIWSTQGDTTYRPSVLYEMALAPIMPSIMRVEPSLVAAIGQQAYASMEQRHAAFTGTAKSPSVPLSVVNTQNPQWAPQICWIYQDCCQHTLSFDVNSDEFSSFIPLVWLAGDTEKSVELVWEVWDSEGWHSAGVTPVEATPFNNSIDPDNIPASIPGTFPIELDLPFTLPPGDNAGQFMLYAIRSYSAIEGQPPIEIRSNPLLINLYRSSTT